MSTKKEIIINIGEVSKIGAEVLHSDAEGTFVIKITGNKFPIKPDNKCESQTEKVNFQQIDLKTPMDTAGLVQKLTEHEISMTQDEEKAAYRVLNEINYYHLSIFFRFLTSEDRSFSRVMELYYFDRFLRNNIELLINPIEEFLKTTLANHLTCKAALQNDGLDDLPPSLIYLDRRIFNLKKHTSQETDHMEHMFYETIVRNLPREESLKHHLKIYNGNIPFWVLVEHLTLGNISSYVNYLDRSWRKDWIDEKMKLDDGELICGPRQIPEWINSLRILRKYVCPHGAPLFANISIQSQF